MSKQQTTATRGWLPPENPPTPQRGKRLLIVDPEELVRWSLVTYLAKWFSVYSTTTQAAADRVLDSVGVEALVVSEDLPESAAEEIEAHAKARNPKVVVIRTITGPPRKSQTRCPVVCLEKPFDLSRLAELLGVRNGTHGAGKADPPSPTTKP